MTNHRQAAVRVMSLLAGSLILSGCISHTATKDSSMLIKDGQTVAFLGDSITAAGASYGNYCRLVVQGLKAKDIYVTPIMAGVSGNTSQHMLGRLDSDVLNHRPDWVILAAGVNDVWHTDPTAKIGVFQPKPGMGVELEDYKKNIREIIKRCNDAGAKVLLTTITPIREDPDTNLNIKARNYNAFLLQLAREHDIPIALLNEAMFSEIAQGTRLTSDGVHPLTEGHRIMAKGILSAIGLSTSELVAIEDEWESSPTVLIMGDRQTTSGSRPGGWITMLLDALNNGREMVTLRTKAAYNSEVTISRILNDFLSKLDSLDRDRYVIIQAPRDDAINGTPQPEYRKDLEALLDKLLTKDTKPILVTIPVQANDPKGELSQKLRPYNDTIRSVAKDRNVLLADINKNMTDRYRADPEIRLTFDGERFNRTGSILMNETLLNAMHLEEKVTPQLRKKWNEQSFYAGRY